MSRKIKPTVKKFLFSHPTLLRLWLNFYPPLFFSGIKIVYMHSDFHRCQVKLKNWPGTRNANGTQFGGSLFSMSDSVVGTMLMAILGVDRYYVWDKKAHIDFISPGIGAVFMVCELTPELIAAIKAGTKNGHKYFATVSSTVQDKRGNEVAKVIRTLYIRLKPECRPAPAAKKEALPATEPAHEEKTDAL